jgi:hypothetical protein
VSGFNEEFRLIENQGRLDILSFHYGFEYESAPQCPFRYALKIHHPRKDVVVQKPGILDSDNHFFETPLAFECFELSEITISKEDYYKRYCQIKFRLFNSDFGQNRVFSVIAPEGPTLHFNIGDFIRLLNVVVARGVPLDVIDEEKLGQFLHVEDVDSVLDMFSEFYVKLYTNDRNRVGKDNPYWEEAEIYKLPRERYLRDLLLAAFNAHGKAEVRADHIFVEFNRDMGWFATEGRKEQKDHKSFHKLLHKTILSFTKEYDMYQRMIANISSDGTAPGETKV